MNEGVAALNRLMPVEGILFLESTPLHEIEYDERSHRYRWKTAPSKGQFISQNTVRSLVERNIKHKQSEVQSITRKMFNKEIKVGEWEKQVANVLKTTTLQNYAIGKPGKLTQADYGRVGGYLRFQYGKLRSFSNSILNGELTKAQISARINQYLSKSREAFSEAKRLYHKDTAWNWERRILAIAKNCSSCVVYSNMGWQPINTLPRITTQCECRANDLCHFEYSNKIGNPDSQVQSVVFVGNDLSFVSRSLVTSYGLVSG